MKLLEIIEFRDNMIHVGNVDILDKTPVLDIKPYIPQFDSRKTSKIGWLKGNIKRKVS